MRDLPRCLSRSSKRHFESPSPKASWRPALSPPPPDFPSLTEAELTSDELRALAADLSRYCKLELVRPKSAPGRMTEARSLPLEDAISAVLEGRIAGLQVHYAYDGELWIDTVMAFGKSYRLVRLQLSTVNATLSGTTSSQ